MKCLFLAPLRYPFIRSIISGMEASGIDLLKVDYLDFFPPRRNQLYNDFTALPRKVRNFWEEPYRRDANKRYLDIFQQYKPDLVFIYNDQLVQPDLIEVFSKKSKIAFMLGDHPLYTPTNIYNLHILFYADYVICPDSMWRDQLSQMGIRNVVFDCFGFNEATNYPMEVSEADRKQYQSDLVYIGSASKTNWGYKRMLFLDQFKNLDFRAYISGSMDRWADIFPGAARKIIPHDRFDPEFNNLVYNCSKIAPVEMVPSLFKGIHVRVFDILGSGILPLCEYGADLETIFEGIETPFIRNYPETEELARFWLNNEQRRQDTVQAMRMRVLEHYTPEMVIHRMLSAVFSPE